MTSLTSGNCVPLYDDITGCYMRQYLSTYRSWPHTLSKKCLCELHTQIITVTRHSGTCTSTCYIWCDYCLFKNKLITFNRHYGCHRKRRTSKIVVTHCKQETFHALQGERSDADLVLACFQYMMGSWHDSLCRCSNTIYLITIYMYMSVWASDVTYTILFSQSYSFIFSH